MPKKPRISKDAFDWIKDTSKEAEETLAPEPELPKPEKNKIPKAARPVVAAEEMGARAKARTVFIRYKDNGEIVEMIEVLKGEKPTPRPYVNVPTGEQVSEFNLTGTLAEKPLIDIHSNYKVDITGASPGLVPKA